MVACRLPTLRENGEKVLRNLRASRNNEVPWKHDDRNCKISPIVPLFFEDESKMINTLRNMYFSEAQRDVSKHAFLNKQDVSLQHASNAVFFFTIFLQEPIAPKHQQPAKEFIPVATTRPETILGDAAVCVHPEVQQSLLYCWWFRNLANHLTCVKPCKLWGYLHIFTISTGDSPDFWTINRKNLIDLGRQGWSVDG